MTGEACEHTAQRRSIPSWTEQASWSHQPFSWSEAGCLEDCRFASSRSQLRNKNPVLGKMGKPESYRSLCMLLFRGTPRWSHPGSGGRGGRSASHPTAPSWTNTRLREYLQTTFPSCFVPLENPQRQWFSHLKSVLVVWGGGGAGALAFFLLLLRSFLPTAMSKLSHLCCSPTEWERSPGVPQECRAPKDVNSNFKWGSKPQASDSLGRSAICHKKGSLKVSFFIPCGSKNPSILHMGQTPFWDTEKRKKLSWARSRQCKEAHSCVLTS